MVGMITNISDRNDTSFLLIDKALSNKIKFSLLKNGVFMYFEWHFHEIFCRIVSVFWCNNIVYYLKNDRQDTFCKIIAHLYTFCGLQKLNTLNFRLF